MRFKDYIKKNYPAINNIPSGYKRHGNFIFLRSQEQLDNKLGEAILSLYPWCEGVYHYKNTIGESRNPEVVCLGGSIDSIIEHKENKVIYIFDFKKIMFSGGNSALRKRLVTIVQEDEFIVDMFAAVGNLSLQPIFYKKINAILIEQDPYTFTFLEKTIDKNNITSVNLINDDCRRVSMSNIADRIFMGYHDVDQSHIAQAIKLSKDRCNIHLHPIAKAGNYEEWITRYTNWIEYYGVKCEHVQVFKVKNYSPGLHHIEIIITVNKLF